MNACALCENPLAPTDPTGLTLMGLVPPDAMSCQTCKVVFWECEYCRRFSMRFVGKEVSACCNKGCVSTGVRWTDCRNCRKSSVPLFGNSAPRICSNPGCATLTVGGCPACGQPLPLNLAACVRPECPAAFHPLEECYFCKAPARDARRARCLSRGCRLYDREVARCAACGEWSVPLTSIVADCANPACPTAAERTAPAPSAPAGAPALERLLDAIAAQSHFEERYELVSVVFSGGMGEIWRATDRVLGREVAIKMAKPHGADDAATREQFLKEAKIGARLLHPDILPVFDVGVNRKRQIYFTMRFVEGASLRKTLDDVATGCATQFIEFPLKRLAGAFLRACKGVDFAHQHGVIHLDLKPDNILVTPFSEVFVIDWGLARVDDKDDTERLRELYKDLADRRNSLTATFAAADEGYAVGTPGYMSPEQVQGRTSSFGAATDVFGLGGVLYYILYGLPPCRPKEATNIPQIFEATLKPQRRGRLRPGIVPHGQRVSKEFLDSVGELERICLKALERDAAARYLRVEDLIIDLNDWFGGARA